MVLLQFRGYSDDTFGEYSHYGIEHDNCADDTPISFEVEAEGKALIVTGQYDRNCMTEGCWDIGVSPQDEDVDFSNWIINMTFEGYTPILNIIAPDDVSVTHIG